MDRNFKYSDQQTHNDQKPSASARPKVPEKPKTLTFRQTSTTKSPKDVTATYGSNEPSLVKVFDTATSDELYDDIDDEFGFFPKESSDTVTVTIKFSSAENGIVAETQKGEPSAVRPKEIRQRNKSTDSDVVVRDTEKKINNTVGAKIEHENNNNIVGSHYIHNDIVTAAFDNNDNSVSPPIPPPRSKKNHRSQTLAAEDLLGLDPHIPTTTQIDSHGLPAYQPVAESTESLFQTPGNQYTQTEKEHARNTISKKLKEVVSPKTSTKIVYDRAPVSPVTSTPIELDRSGPADQDEGEDFMEYLKGLRAEISSSSSESDDNEHVLYARRQSNIGGSGANGFHLDDVQTLSDDDYTIRVEEEQVSNTHKIEDENECDIESEEISKAIANTDTDKHESESENSENDTDDDKSDKYDEENNDENDDGDENEDDKDDDGNDDDDDDNDENTGDDTSNDDDQYFDGNENGGSDREGSYYDSSADSSDESNGDENFFVFTPGLRSRCNILARNIDETDDFRISTKMKLFDEFSSSLVEKILVDVISNISGALECSRKAIKDDNQVYEIEQEINKSITGDSNIMDMELGSENGAAIDSTTEILNGSFKINKIDETIQTFELKENDLDSTMASANCFSPDGTTATVLEHSNDSINGNHNHLIDLSPDNSDLNWEVLVKQKVEESCLNTPESSHGADSFPDIDENTKCHKTCIDESTKFPHIDESAEFPDIDESAEFPDINESKEFLDIDESTKFPDIDGSTDFQDSDESTKFPDIDESTEFPDIDESAEFPDIDEFTEFPDIDKSTIFPDIDESTDFPDSDESTKFPDIDESTEFPDIDESTEFADIDAFTEFPDIDKSTNFPYIDESTKSVPDIDESTESVPDIDESTEFPDFDESTESPDFDGSTETEFESANDDESDDYWSVNLEQTLDGDIAYASETERSSEHNGNNTEYTYETDSCNENECTSSGTCSSECFPAQNSDSLPEDISDRIVTCTETGNNENEHAASSSTNVKGEPMISNMNMALPVQRDIDTGISSEVDVKLSIDESLPQAKETYMEKAEITAINTVDHGNRNTEPVFSNGYEINRNKSSLSEASITDENCSCEDVSNGETLKHRNEQIGSREDDCTEELQTNSAAPEQLFDHDLSTAFKDVNELIENMEYNSNPQNVKPQCTKQKLAEERNCKNRSQTLTMEESSSVSEKKDTKVRRKNSRTTTGYTVPKIRTITYNMPYIIQENQTEIKLTPEERRQHMMLCKKKMSLLYGRKRNENTQRNKINRQRIVKKSDFYVVASEENAEKSVPIPVTKPQTFKVGTGYIILKAGEMLNIPNGQNVNLAKNGPDSCQGRPCKYFRGLPGVINNAYKMSNSFPKARPPSTAPPNHILHACNRLATPIIPTTTPSPSKERYGIMLEAATSQEDTDDEIDLKEILDKARDHLNNSKFDDAEAAFLKLYQQIQEKPEDNGKLLVETLTGLADICIRRSRMCRSNPLEWQWLCMHAIALLQYTVEFCDSELEDEHDNQLSEWLQEHKNASELKCRPLEDAFVRALYNSLKHNANFFDPFQSFSLPNTPIHSSRKTNLFPLSTNMPQYLVIPGMRYRVTDQGLQKQSADDSNMAVDWLAKFQHYCKDRLQTKDSKECTEKILKSNASKADDDDDTASVVSQGSQGSLDWDNGDLQGIDELSEEVVDEESPVKDFSLAFELASVDSGKESWEFFLDKRQNCDFQTVVQVSGESTEGQGEKDDENTETTNKETEDVRQQEKHTRIALRDMISPLHEHSISLTLSRSFCRLADKLVQEEEYKKAEAVYDKILDIIDTIQDGTAGMLKFSARIMKNLGTVKSKLGKSSSGLALLNKALQTYRDLQDEEANFEIAIALIELGNGYIVGKNHEDSVFEDVIIAICDFFEKDSGDPQSTSTSSCGSTSVMTSSLRSNDEERNVEEAVMCYSEAISLLDTYAADERQNEMFAKAIMRLGDCFFMQNDYDRALDCYERALGMFRACNIFGKDSLMENAHVLCMLGVSSFMLHVYPRAASVFETALHMVKCAYGFRRTFLNGMLQSLCGITYYKMKNYHKCVSMCYQSFETYCDIYGEELTRLNKQKFWLVCQTLYVMGNSYNILSLYQKSIKYLTTARSLMKSSKSRERRQFMRVLQILGDSYFAQYDYKTALTFYNEALEYGECESTISFDEVFDPNLATDEMAIHNRLVSKSAEAHLSMQQYQNAVHYLEQAHDIQEVLGEDIKEDLINTLNQLGEMHSLAGDVDKAIESYKECLEVFREIHEGELGPDMCPTLGNLAAICYVKACLSDEIEQELHMIQMADQYFKEALKLDTDDSVCVKYANFLYSQGHYEEAINDLNDALQFEDHMQMCDIVYTGLEKITLPDLLQDEVDTQEEICLPSACLARYLLILCYKAIGQNEEAETNLIGLMDDVTDYDIPLLHSLLGYAMMELSLFEEAAFSFFKAFETEEDYILASENFCICAIIILMKTFENAVFNIWEYYRIEQKRSLNYAF